MTIDPRYAPHAIAALRIALGLMFLAHSVVLKLHVFGLPATARFFESVGLPGPLAYLVFAVEVVGGLMLVLGIQARWAVLALTPILAGALWVHAGNGWVFSAEGGGWEYPAYLTLLGVAQFFLGDGAWALSPSRPLPDRIAASGEGAT